MAKHSPGPPQELALETEKAKKPSTCSNEAARAAGAKTSARHSETRRRAISRYPQRRSHEGVDRCGSDVAPESVSRAIRGARVEWGGSSPKRGREGSTNRYFTRLDALLGRVAPGALPQRDFSFFSR